jgi:hypothetical protein
MCEAFRGLKRADRNTNATAAKRPLKTDPMLYSSFIICPIRLYATTAIKFVEV